MAAADLVSTFVTKLRILGPTGALRTAWSIVKREGSAGFARRLRAWRHGSAADSLDRAGAGSSVTTAGQAATPAATAATSGGINLVGHPYGALGMGEHIRKSAGAFAAAQVPFVVVNTFDQVGPHGDMFIEFPHHDLVRRESPYPVSLFHLNADEMKLAAAHLGEQFFSGRYNIGYWAWELARFPDAWCSAFAFFDEIWAPSRFIQQAVAEKAPCPVVHMPLAVDFPAGARLPRSHFGLPDDRFLFLFYFDFTSYVARKNPFGPLAAFRKAFPRAAGARTSLVIKLNGMAHKPADHRRFIDELGDTHDDVILIDQVMTDQEVKSLVQNCDAFVSLHRSEGFGRGLAEGMYFGKPVIGTAYSGNLDYMNPDNACLVDALLVPVREGEYPFPEGQLWADPDIDQAAHYMRRLVDEPAWARAIGARAAAYMRTQHGFAAIGARYRRRLEQLGFVSS
jgi:glycosyltransferase involved in cell wall biosynthesis